MRIHDIPKSKKLVTCDKCNKKYYWEQLKKIKIQNSIQTLRVCTSCKTKYKF